MNYAKCATCHGLNSMGFCQYTACRQPSTESGVVNASAYVPKIVTNADRIRSMTDEELAEWLDNVCESAYDEGYTKETDEPQMSPYPTSPAKWATWLRQEAGE